MIDVSFVSVWGNGIKITDPNNVDASVVVERPWGKEIRVDLTDETRIHTFVFTYQSMPTKAQVRDDVLAKIAQLEAVLNYEPPTKIIIAQDGTEITVLESDCPVNIDLTISVTPTQLQAWNLIRPILKEYLSKIIKVYRILPQEKKSELREHSSLLDQVLDMVEED